MKIDPESVALARDRLSRVFLHWRAEADQPGGGERMAIIDQKLLVRIIKEYEARHQALPLSRTAPPRGVTRMEPVSPPPHPSAAQAAMRGGVAAGEQGERRPPASDESGYSLPPSAVRKPVGLRLSRQARRRQSSSLTPQESGSTERSAVSGSSVSAGDDGVGEGYGGENWSGSGMSAYGVDDAAERRLQFARSAAHSALTPGFFKMDESQWLEDLAEALPAAGRHEVHYTNAAGYWLGLSMTATEMSAETDLRSKDDITGLLAFSSVLASVASKVLATRFTYFDVVVNAGLGAGARYASSVESPEAIRGTSEDSDDASVGQQFSASELSSMFPPQNL